MAVNISIKNAPDELVSALRERAKRNHRSLQGEVLSILDEALCKPHRPTIDEILAKARQLGLPSEPSGTSIIRSDRDSR